MQTLRPALSMLSMYLTSPLLQLSYIPRAHQFFPSVPLDSTIILYFLLLLAKGLGSFRACLSIAKTPIFELFPFPSILLLLLLLIHLSLPLLYQTLQSNLETCKTISFCKIINHHLLLLLLFIIIII